VIFMHFDVRSWTLDVGRSHLVFLRLRATPALRGISQTGVCTGVLSITAEHQSSMPAATGVTTAS
jgi:hypothetical protein